MVASLDSFLRRLLRVETVLCVAILGALIGIITLQVLLRYLLNNPLTWAEELASLLLIHLSFLSGDVVYKRKAHISIDYLVGLMPRHLQTWSGLAVNVLTGVALAVFTATSIPLIDAQFGYTTAAALPLPKSYWTMSVPIIFGSMLLTTLSLSLHQIADLRRAD